MNSKTLTIPSAEYSNYAPQATARYNELRTRVKAVGAEGQPSNNQRVAAAAMLACVAPVLLMAQNGAMIYQYKGAGVSASEVQTFNQILPAVRSYMDFLLDASEAALDGSLPAPTISEAAQILADLRAMSEKAQGYADCHRRYRSTAVAVEASVVECLSQFATIAGGFMLEDDEARESFTLTEEGQEALALLAPLVKTDGANWKPGHHMASGRLLSALRTLDLTVAVYAAKLPQR